ncbi:hypothetical protein [Flavobacterium sp. XGLA_31]
MRIDLIIYGIIGILAINLFFFFLIQNKKTDKGLRDYLKNHSKN